MSRRLRPVVAVYTVTFSLLVLAGLHVHGQHQDEQISAREALQAQQYTEAKTKAVRAKSRFDAARAYEKQREQARADRITAAAAESAPAVAARDAAVAAATAALAAGAGKVSGQQLGALQAATDEAGRTGTLVWVLERRTVRVTKATDEVKAAITAWEAEQARLAEERRRAEEAARAAARKKSGGASSGSSRASAGGSAAPAGAGGGDVYAVAERTLRSLPGNSGVTISWDNAALGNHLGGVFVGGSNIMLNSRRLSQSPGKTASVVKHEIAHVYQGRAMRNAGVGEGELRARLNAVFGSNGLEKSADCVALRLGASWVHYSSSCGGAAKQAAVTALINGRLP